MILRTRNEMDSPDWVAVKLSGENFGATVTKAI